MASPPSRRPQRPADVARRLGERNAEALRRKAEVDSAWKRETFTLPRDEARQKAREAFNRFPKAAYMTEIEWWRELDDGRIEFTIRRLPTAD
jgi:hypothetical protein